MPGTVAIKLKPLFQRLQQLNLHRVSVQDDKTLFADFDSLIELILIGVENSRAILENIFPKLERFNHYGEYIVLTKFISRHTNLKARYLNTDKPSLNGARAILQSIGSSCKTLENFSLELGRTNDSLQALQTLKLLKTLKLRFSWCSNFKFVPALTQLRELYLIGGRIPRDSNQFALLTQLTKLYIIEGDI